MASASTGALPQVPVFLWPESQVSIAHSECTEWPDVIDDFGKGGPAPLRRPGSMESDDPYGERPVPSQFDLEVKGVGGQGGSQDCGHDAKHDPCAGDPETWCPISCAALSHAVGDGAHIPLPVLSYVIDSETVDYVTTAVTRATRLPSLCRFFSRSLHAEVAPKGLQTWMLAVTDSGRHVHREPDVCLAEFLDPLTASDQIMFVIGRPDVLEDALGQVDSA